MKMHRTQICITNKQRKSIEMYTNKNEISKSELIRRIIDTWIQEQEKNDTELQSA